MRRLTVVLTSLLLLVAVAACTNANDKAGIAAVNYSLDGKAASFYGSFALTEDIKISVEYAGIEGVKGELGVDALYQIVGDGLSSLDVGIGVGVTTPIKASVVIQGTNYVSPKAFLHSSAAYQVSPSPSELIWSVGAGYDFTDSLFATVTYGSNGMALGCGLRF